VHWRVTPRESDIESVRELVAETGFFSIAEQQIAAELVEESLTRGSAAGYEFVFADMPGRSDRLLGYTCFGPIPATVSSYDLYWIAVSPSQQRLGLGGQLLRESERVARQRKATQMFVDTSGREGYAPTRAFYERMGYSVAANIADFYAPGDDKVIYTRRLVAKD
jgi:ribosomal protein S18 acetylase RimI-like enzyme